jgi:cobalt-zinc-cadmium efflux system outer membrane protein
MTAEQKRRAINDLLPRLEPLPKEPVAQPGPGGKPYTLTVLQSLATQHSAALKQAAAAVDAARGTMLQARTYPNPSISYGQQPSSGGLSPSMQVFSLEQPIKTDGKLKLQEAAARMDYLNAELALRRARSDLSTQVRNAYFALLVAQETMRVNRAVALMTEEVYRTFVDQALSTLTALSEPAALQAQAEQARLLYVQSLNTYRTAWRQLVAAIGLREQDMPLSEVAGRIDAFVPRYKYEEVLAQVLTRHTDILTAQNGLQKADYTLKLARITPWFQDFDVTVSVSKDYSVPPNNVVPGISISTPLPVWDQNKGNIIAAEATMSQALEQQHAFEQTWTTTMATNFLSYENNIKGLEYYRRILPELVLYYRGVLFRLATLGTKPANITTFRFTDLVTAQQALTTGVASYLALLGQVWTSAVNVADPLQTDDLFQMGRPEALPPIPDLEHLPPLPCGHDCPPQAGMPDASCAPVVTLPPAVQSAPVAPKATTGSAVTMPAPLTLRPIRHDAPLDESAAPVITPAVGTVDNSALFSPPRPGGKLP